MNGVREFKFEDMLWPGTRKLYRAEPGDAELSVLTSRRSTIESIIRSYAEEHSRSIFHSGYSVQGIVCERNAQGIPVAKAYKVKTPDGLEETWEGDILIDATGRGTPFPRWLKDYGMQLETEVMPVPNAYFTRHYRFHPGQSEPERESVQQSGGEFGFIRGGIYPGDGGNFSITLMVPEVEEEMRLTLRDPDVFEAMARKLPDMARWIDPARTYPVTKVLGMRDMHSVWHHWLKNNRPVILNFFAIGDATASTNPLFGRGCTIGFIHAHLLADVLLETADPVTRTQLFAARAHQEIRPHFDAMVRQDQAIAKRAANLRDPSYKPTFRDRLQTSFGEDAVGPASRSSMRVLRAMSRSLHMLDKPTAWLRRPDILAYVLATWATPRRFKKRFYPQRDPLQRSEFLAIAREKLAADKDREPENSTAVRTGT